MKILLLTSLFSIAQLAVAATSNTYTFCPGIRFKGRNTARVISGHTGDSLSRPFEVFKNAVRYCDAQALSSCVALDTFADNANRFYYEEIYSTIPGGASSGGPQRFLTGSSKTPYFGLAIKAYVSVGGFFALTVI